MTVRRIWIVLLLLGVVPAALFFVLQWTGAANNLRYVATTGWQPGDPSVLQIILLFLSMISWAWLKGLGNLFIGAALPFLIADLWRVLARKKE